MMLIFLVIACLIMPMNILEASVWPAYSSVSIPGRYQHAAISSDAPECAEVGSNIFERGGTAVDAAISVLVCMGAHIPHSMGIGGGFLMLYYNRAQQKAYYLDSREAAPRKATVDMFHGNTTLASEGGLSIAIPGEVKGYSTAYKHFGGGVPWQDLFTPTVKMCREDGIGVNTYMAKAQESRRESLMKYDAIKQVFLKDGKNFYEVGERIKMPALANTLEEIGRLGEKALYGPSELADKFLADLKAAGSIIDEVDMSNYAPRFREPVQASLRNSTTMYTIQIPGSGALLAFMLSVLDGYPDMDESIHSSEEKEALAYHRMIEAMKFAYAQRSKMEDEDTEEMKQLIKKLTSRKFADYVRSQIDDTKTKKNPKDYDIQFGFTEDHGTAHLSIIAPNGDAVAVTSTINQYFGSLVLSPSTGILLNDEMDDFSSPGFPNMFGLPPQTTNHVRPGKKPVSSMCPSIFVDGNGDVKLVIGGVGGTKITTGVLQVAARNLFFGEGIKQSIDAPRIHHQLYPEYLFHETSFPEAMLERLRKFGHVTHPFTGMVNNMMGVKRGDDGYLYANSDFRKGGDVYGF